MSLSNYPMLLQRVRKLLKTSPGTIIIYSYRKKGITTEMEDICDSNLVFGLQILNQGPGPITHSKYFIKDYFVLRPPGPFTAFMVKMKIRDLIRINRAEYVM